MAYLQVQSTKTWVAGPSPAMTIWVGLGVTWYYSRGRGAVLEVTGPNGTECPKLSDPRLNASWRRIAGSTSGDDHAGRL